MKKHPSLAGALASATLDHSLRSWSISVDSNEYRTSLSAKERSVIGGSYAFLAQCCLGHVAAWSKRASLGPLALFPEQGHKGFKHLSQVLTMLTDSPQGRQLFNLARWAPATKADLPAHCPDLITHYLTACDGNVVSSPTLMALARKHRHIHFNGNQLTVMFQQVMRHRARLKAHQRANRKKVHN